MYVYVCSVWKCSTLFPLLILLQVLLIGKKCSRFWRMRLAAILMCFSRFFHVAISCWMELVSKVQLLVRLVLLYFVAVAGAVKTLFLLLPSPFCSCCLHTYCLSSSYSLLPFPFFFSLSSSSLSLSLFFLSLSLSPSLWFLLCSTTCPSVPPLFSALFALVSNFSFEHCSV